MSTSANAAPGEGMPLELDQEFCRGGFFIPRQLRRDLIAPGVKDCTRSLVYFFASLTIGWRARFVVLSYGDIIQGPIINQKRWTDELSGLTSDHAIRDALAQAKANNMIEVKYTPWGTAYALHKRYWQQMLAILPRMAPKYDVLYRSVYNPDADPLTDESQSAYNLAASGDSDAPSPAYKLEATKPDSQKKQGPSAYNLVADNRENMPPLAYNLVASRQQKQGSVAYKLEASESEIPPVVTPGRLKIVSKPAPAKEEDTDPLLTIGLQGCLQLGSGAAYKLLATEQLPAQAPSGANAPPKDTSKILLQDTKDTYGATEESSDGSDASDDAVLRTLEEKDEIALREEGTSPSSQASSDVSDSQPQQITPASARLYEKQAVKPKFLTTWQTILERLRTTVTDSTFDAWLRGLEVIGSEGLVLYLQAQTSAQARIFQQRFANQASYELSQIARHPDAEVRCLPPPDVLPAAQSEPEPPVVPSEPPDAPEPEPPAQDLFTAISDGLGFGTDTKHLNEDARKAVGRVKKQMLQIGIERGDQAALVIAKAREKIGPRFEAYLMLPALPKYARLAGVIA